MIYFLHCDASGLTKIGKARNPVTRVRDIQGMSGGTLRVVCLLRGYSEQESALHRHFKDRRRHGEWFDLRGVSIPGTVSGTEPWLGVVGALPSWQEPPELSRTKYRGLPDRSDHAMPRVCFLTCWLRFARGSWRDQAEIGNWLSGYTFADWKHPPTGGKELSRLLAARHPEPWQPHGPHYVGVHAAGYPSGCDEGKDLPRLYTCAGRPRPQPKALWLSYDREPKHTGPGFFASDDVDGSCVA